MSVSRRDYGLRRPKQSEAREMLEDLTQVAAVVTLVLTGACLVVLALIWERL